MDAVTLTKNANIDKYGYSGYGIGFDRTSAFSFPDGVGFGQNVIIFGVDMSSSAHIGHKKKDISFRKKDQWKRNSVWAYITIIFLWMVQKFTNLKQVIQKLYQLHYAYEIFQKIGQ